MVKFPVHAGGEPPGNLAIPAEEGVSLQLSGHTHGGQIWPWHWPMCEQDAGAASIQVRALQ